MSLRRFQLLAALPVLGALFGIAGCGETKPTDSTEEAADSLTQAQDKAAPTDVAPPAGAPQGGPMHPLARMVNELAVVVPLLDSTQRETLAAQLEKGPPGAHERGARGSSGGKIRGLVARNALARAGAREVRSLLAKDASSTDAQARKAAGVAFVALGELPRAAVLAVDVDARVRDGVACSMLMRAAR